MSFSRIAPAPRLALPAQRRSFVPLLRPLPHASTHHNKAPADRRGSTEVVCGRLAALMPVAPPGDSWYCLRVMRVPPHGAAGWW